MSSLKVLPKRMDIIDVNDAGSEFRINIDVLNEAFGIGRKMYAKAVYPDKRGAYFIGDKYEDRFIIWMPKLYGNSSNWKNVLSEDGTEIYEIAENDRQEDWISEESKLPPVLRIVFVKQDRNSPYKFVGVFENGKMDFCNHTYRRIATKVELVGNPVNRIHLLDDIR